MKKTLAMLGAAALTISLTACGATQSDADQTASAADPSSATVQTTPPEVTDGERPELPDGELPQFSDGERPELPDGELPQFSDGERPELPDGERPRFSDGERPQFNGPMDRPEEGTQPSSEGAQTQDDTEQTQP